MARGVKTGVCVQSTKTKRCKVPHNYVHILRSPLLQDETASSEKRSLLEGCHMRGKLQQNSTAIFVTVMRVVS